MHVLLVMLVNIENSNEANIKKLIDFANQQQLRLSFIDDQDNKHRLAGRPFTEQEMQALIEKSRSSGMIAMKDAHSIIRQIKDAD